MTRPQKNILEELKNQTPKHLLNLAEHVWEHRNLYIEWPCEAILLMPGSVRVQYHVYPNEVKEKLKLSGISIDTRSNGPAICAFLLAGGKRPIRNTSRRSWSVHHIYDGQFSLFSDKPTTHAVKDGRYFTQSAGLVSVHPIADALADELPYFAWLLRQEAYQRFGFDPDGVIAT